MNNKRLAGVFYMTTKIGPTIPKAGVQYHILPLEFSDNPAKDRRVYVRVELVRASSLLATPLPGEVVMNSHWLD